MVFPYVYLAKRLLKNLLKIFNHVSLQQRPKKSLLKDTLIAYFGNVIRCSTLRP